jgi:predicted deacylase
LVAPGGRFAAGDALAEIRGLEGQRIERLRAAESGVVIALPERGWVEEGAVVATVAIPAR